MKIILRSKIIKDIPQMWREQYSENSGEKYEIWEKLRKEKNLTEEKANQIIGNGSWSSLDCDECENEVDAVIQLGQEPDYDSNTVHVCLKCLNKALKLIVK